MEVKKLYTYLIIAFLIFSGCKTDINPIPVYDLDPIIRQTIDSSINKEKIILNICNKNNPWDSIAVIGAYSKAAIVEEVLMLDNFSSIEEKIEEFEMRDNYTILLFIKNKNIINYDTVRGTPVYFGFLTPKSNDMPPIIYVKDCNKILLTKTQFKDNFYIQIVPE